MKVALAAAALFLVPLLAPVQTHRPRLVEFELQDLGELTNEISSRATKNAAILTLLKEASRALDDWQSNKAVAVAVQRIGKAKQLAWESPAAPPRVQQAVLAAADILKPAEASTMEANLMGLRGQLDAGPIEVLREAVAEDMADLAAVAKKMAEMNATLTKALAEIAAVTVK